MISPVLLVCSLPWVILACAIALVLLAVHFWIISRVKRTTAVSQTNEAKEKARERRLTLVRDIGTVLRKRCSLFWRYKTRLLLVAGDEAATEQLAPGLCQQCWLEGQRTALIYGGGLFPESDSQQYTTLHKLRRGRPPDRTVWVMPSSLTLAPRMSRGDLHRLEKTGELLGYAASVRLQKLYDSEWSRVDRTMQVVGISLLLRVNEDDVARQLAQILPMLWERGMHQIIVDICHDFLLHLRQRLTDGEIAQWCWQLTPWLTTSRQWSALHGLVFSLPGPHTVDPYREMDTSPAGRPHLLTLPATWQGVVDDCRHLRGHHVGTIWERGLACGLSAILGL